MDEFAQSREDDDLFADEFEAIPEPTIAIENDKHVADHTGAASTEASRKEAPPVGTAEPSRQGQQHGGHGGQRHGQGGRGQHQGQGGRGQADRRGRGGGRGKPNAGLGASRYADPPESNPAPAANPTPQPSPNTNLDTSTTQEPTPDTPPAPQETTSTIEPPATMRTPAVRGDRSATGGPAHKKLTEEELTAKMEKMAIVNAQKAERHRLSEADQAAFQHREKELAKERKEKAVVEKRNERAMEMERAKNRERKMKAQGVREWDSEKVESDIVDGKSKGRSSEYVRGGHGGVIRGGAGLGGSRYAVDTGESTGGYESAPRGRGERGGRGRGGRGGARGGKASSTAVPTAEDFPSLPTPAKTTPITTSTPKSSTPPAVSKEEVEKVLSPMAESGAHDWAEEMATPVEAPAAEKQLA